MEIIIVERKLLFDTHVFKSWPSILAGALFFAMLFTLVGLMSELVLEGAMRMTRNVLALSLLAFVGYIAVAVAIKRGGPSH